MIAWRKFFGAFLLLSSVIAGCIAPARVETTPTPCADGLTDQQAATLSSLQKVDAHPLYTMRYIGAYDTRQSFAAPVVERAWGCSLFAALGDPNGMFYGRNFDWEHSPAILLFTEPPNGYASVAMVDIAYLGFIGARANNIADLPLAERRALLSAPLLPFDGMNARGLVVGMAAVPPGNVPRDPSKPTVDSVRIIREMLDCAATVDEAVAIMQRHNIDFTGGPPIHYLIADATGRATLVEFYQGKTFVIPNETPWHQATNFLRRSVDDAQGKCWRYDTLAQRLTASAGRVSGQDALKLLQDVSQKETQWSIVYGMNTGKITVTMGRNYANTHTFDLKMESK
ncbi:MAG: C45 family peptidase [Chloroflexota bacterium]